MSKSIDKKVTFSDTSKHTLNTEVDNAPSLSPAEDSKSQNGGARSRRRGSSFLLEYSVDYKGQNESIGVILCLRHERFKNKTIYTAFVDCLKTYVLTSFNNASDIIKILEELKDPKPGIESNEPKDLEGSDATSEVKKWKKQAEVRKFYQRLTDLDNNQETLYGVIWGQCSNRLQELIKANDEFTARSKSFDCIWLLKQCKMISAGVDAKANKHSTLVKALTALCNIRQGKTESNDSFRKRVDAYALTLKLSGGEHIMCSPTLIKASNKKEPTEDKIEVEEDKFKAMLMILCANHIRYGALQKSLFEGVYKGRDEFPTTITMAYDLLQNIAGDVTSYTRVQNQGRRRFNFGRNNRNNSNVTFTQKSSNEEVVPGIDGHVYPRITCHNCGKKGHFCDKCNVVAGTSKNNKVTLAHFSLTQGGLEIIDKSWVLLDTGLTVSVFCNRDLVSNVNLCEPGQGITVITNGGLQSFEEEADANLLPIKVHFNPDLLANILSMSDVANLPGACVTMDSSMERAILLHYNGEVIRFNECADGLYAWIPEVNSVHNPNTPITAYSTSLTQTVAYNKSLFSNKDVKKADAARRVQHVIGWPGDQQFQNILSKNLINNCASTVDDAH